MARCDILLVADDRDSACPNEASWHPRMMVRAAGYEQQPCPSILGLNVCHEHKAMKKLEDFLSDAGWEQISNALIEAGRIAPTRSLTTLEWEPIDSTASRELHARRRS